MATTKVKGTSKKIKELKGIKAERVTDEQLKKIQDTVNNINRSQLELGMMELKKHDMMHNIATVRDSLIAFQAELEKDYGTFDIDIQTGVINYDEDVKADS